MIGFLRRPYSTAKPLLRKSSTAAPRSFILYRTYPRSVGVMVGRPLSGCEARHKALAAAAGPPARHNGRLLVRREPVGLRAAEQRCAGEVADKVTDGAEACAPETSATASR